MKDVTRTCRLRREGCQKTFRVKRLPRGDLSRAQLCPACYKLRTAETFLRNAYRCETVWTPERDAHLREHYRAKRGTIRELARILGVGLSTVMHRAQVLGLSHPQNQRAWTSDEVSFLQAHAGLKPTKWIARRLNRSPSSVATKGRSLDLRMRAKDGYTAQDLAQGFGVTQNTVRAWIQRGLLVSRRRFGGKKARFRTDAHCFQDESVRDFIKRNPNAFRLDRVEQTWFIDMAFGVAVGD